MNEKERETGEEIEGSEKLPDLARLFLWADDRHKVEKVVIGLCIFCALLFVIDLFYHRHAYFGFEGSRGFYAIAGFAAFAIIVLAAGQLRRLIKRPENYYGERATHAETYPDEGLGIQIAAGFSAPIDRRSVIPADSTIVSDSTKEGSSR